MTQDEIFQEATVRFWKFRDHFRANKALPGIAVGMRVADGVAMLAIYDGLSDDQAEELLAKALDTLRRDRARALEPPRNDGPENVNPDCLI